MSDKLYTLNEILFDYLKLENNNYQPYTFADLKRKEDSNILTLKEQFQSTDQRRVRRQWYNLLQDIFMVNFEPLFSCTSKIKYSAKEKQSIIDLLTIYYDDNACYPFKLQDIIKERNHLLKNTSNSNSFSDLDEAFLKEHLEHKAPYVKTKNGYSPETDIPTIMEYTDFYQKLESSVYCIANIIYERLEYVVISCEDKKLKQYVKLFQNMLPIIKKFLYTTCQNICDISDHLFYPQVDFGSWDIKNPI